MTHPAIALFYYGLQVMYLPTLSQFVIAYSFMYLTLHLPPRTFGRIRLSGVATKHIVDMRFQTPGFKSYLWYLLLWEAYLTIPDLSLLMYVLWSHDGVLAVGASLHKWLYGNIDMYTHFFCLAGRCSGDPLR
jgi:hypothetical protein